MTDRPIPTSASTLPRVVGTIPGLTEVPVIASAIFALLVLTFLLVDVMDKKDLVTLLFAKQWAVPSFMPDDLALTRPAGPRALSLALFAPFVRNFSLMTVALGGRLLSFAFFAWGLARLARRVGLDALAATAIVGLYIACGQAIVPHGEWMFGPIESKVVAYVLLLFAIDLALGGRFAWAAALTGLATGFHPLVGFWGSVSLFGALVVVRQIGWRDLAIAAGAWLVAAAPGALLSFASVVSADPAAAAQARQIYVYFRNPHHLDASRFWWESADVALVAGLLLVSFVVVVRRQGAERLFAAIALVSFVPYVLGSLAVHTSLAPYFLMTYPHRVGSVFLLLFGFWVGLPWLARGLLTATGARLAAAGMVLWAVQFGWDRWHEGVRELRHFPRGAVYGGFAPTRAMYDACDWVRLNTPRDTCLLTSPDRPTESVPYLCNRPTPVRFREVPPGTADLLEWYRRLVDLNGGREPRRVGYGAAAEVARHFDHDLAEADYRRLGEFYGCQYLMIPPRRLALPLVYQNERWHVYALTAPKPHVQPSPAGRDTRTEMPSASRTK